MPLLWNIRENHPVWGQLSSKNVKVSAIQVTPFSLRLVDTVRRCESQAIG
jgi:hypothetical protein